MDLDNTNLNDFSEKEIILSDKSIDFLLKTAPWIKFISIFGAAYMAILVLIIAIAFAFVGIVMLPALLMIALSAIISYFPFMYMFKYSKHLKEACKTKDFVILENAFDMQKRFWKFYGIATIIGVGFLILYFMFLSIIGLNIFDIIQPNAY